MFEALIILLETFAFCAAVCYIGGKIYDYMEIRRLLQCAEQRAEDDE